MALVIVAIAVSSCKSKKKCPAYSSINKTEIKVKA